MYALFADPQAAEQALVHLEALGLGPDAVRTYGRTGDGHTGSFADSGEHEHSPARDHVGSFADTDPGSALRARLERDLVAAGVPDLLAQVEAGAQLVLVGAAAGQNVVASASLAQRG
jgi:hypothetical protein